MVKFIGLLSAFMLVLSAEAYSSSFVPRATKLAYRPSVSKWSMKLFDWKRREADESYLNDVENYEFTFTSVKPAPGSRKRKMRKGRGIAAGKGATCGFGMRGQKSRSGRSVRPGFEGGQTPLYRRLPKYRGRPLGPGHKRKIYNLIKLDKLNKTKPGETVNFDTLFKARIVTKSKYKIHKVVVGREEFTAKGIIVQAHAFTKTARAAIEEAGGTCQLLKRTTGEVIEEPVKA